MPGAQFAAVLIASSVDRNVYTERRVADDNDQQQSAITMTIYGPHVFGRLGNNRLRPHSVAIAVEIGNRSGLDWR
jgi:hypothetical protein